MDFIFVTSFLCFLNLYHGRLFWIAGRWTTHDFALPIYCMAGTWCTFKCRKCIRNLTRYKSQTEIPFISWAHHSAMWVRFFIFAVSRTYESLFGELQFFIWIAVFPVTRSVLKFYFQVMLLYCSFIWLFFKYTYSSSKFPETKMQPKYVVLLKYYSPMCPFHTPW